MIVKTLALVTKIRRLPYFKVKQLIRFFGFDTISVDCWFFGARFSIMGFILLSGIEFFVDSKNVVQRNKEPPAMRNIINLRESA